MSETKPGETDIDTESPLVAERLQDEHHGDTEQSDLGSGATGEPTVTNPARAGTTEQTGGWGTGTPGSSLASGLDDVAPIESDVTEEYGSAPQEQTTPEGDRRA